MTFCDRIDNDSSNSYILSVCRCCNDGNIKVILGSKYLQMKHFTAYLADTTIMVSIIMFNITEGRNKQIKMVLL